MCDSSCCRRRSSAENARALAIDQPGNDVLMDGLDVPFTRDPKRKFLQGFSKKSLRRMVDFTIEHGDEPKFIAVRKRLAGWLLAQEVADLAAATDVDAVLLSQEIALDIAAAALDRSEVRARRRAAIERMIATFQHRTLGEVLAELGITFTPDMSALAAATTYASSITAHAFSRLR